MISIIKIKFSSENSFACSIYFKFNSFFKSDNLSEEPSLEISISLRCRDKPFKRFTSSNPRTNISLYLVKIPDISLLIIKVDNSKYVS